MLIVGRQHTRAEWERRQAARQPRRRALRAVLWGAAWLAGTAALTWFLWGCAEPTARDAASTAYTDLYMEMSRRATTPDDVACLTAIEAVWQRAWAERRDAAVLAWLVTGEWRYLPACRRATFGGAP